MLKNTIFTRLSLVLVLFFAANTALNAKLVEVKNSVLATGDWYRIKIEDTGIYKLTYENLKSMGLKDPKKVQIYGYGGNILDENFANSSYQSDLPKLAIWMSKSPDQFGAGDYILFYAKGSIKWTLNGNNTEFVHQQNPYSSESYYFVTENNDGANIVETAASLPLGNTEVNAFDDYLLHEIDAVNLLESGRRFFGERVRGSNNDFSFTLTGLVSGSSAIIRHSFIAKPIGSVAAKLVTKINGDVESSQIITPIPTGDALKASEVIFSTTKKLANESLTVRLEYTESSISDINTHLDYIRVNYLRTLKPYGAVTLFRSKTKNSDLGFKISEANSNLLVFDVTDNSAMKKIDANLSGSELSFGASNNIVREYALVDVSKTIPSPTVVGKVSNQNLHALNTPEMVIIVQPFLQQYAEELAELHKEESGMETLIVNPDLIYNEFSSGKPDITAYRRLLKMFYDRQELDNNSKNKLKNKLKYVLLFGDGTFDNRFITQEWDKADKRGILLTYQTDASLHDEESFTTDDYIGFLHDNEGGALTKASLDVGIGRFPVRTQSDAAVAVRKVSRYMKNEERGIWQNTVTLVADDAVTLDKQEIVHIEQTDGYANTLNANYPNIITKKVYEDIFERVVNSNGARYPDAQRALFDALNKGTLVLNYVGHGSTRDWSHEYILTYPLVEAVTNSKLPLWITATCDFSRYDGVNTSGGEAAFLNPKGGAIALFSTVRVVFISSNDQMCKAIYKYLFKEDENGKALRLGDIMKYAKQEISGGDNKLRFLLLGDPALKLNYPDNKHSIKVRSINSEDVSTSIQIQALANTTIVGEVVDVDGKVVDDFNGSLESIIFDNEQNLRSRGHAPGGGTLDNLKWPYKDYTNSIYAGKADVVDGKFTISFVTPKDILYTNGEGKMSFYAYSASNSKEAQGYFTNYNVNGTSAGAVPETKAPDILEMYLNNSSFTSGGKVNNTPLFFADISDDTGLNLSNAIGHNMSIIIDNATSYDLSSFFVNHGTSSKAGYIRYSIPQLSQGKHSLQFKVWDVWNNSATRNIDFEVVNDYKPNIYEFSLLGTPAKESVRFVFTSDVAGSKMDVQYDVFSMNGARLWTHKESGTNISEYIYDWDLTTTTGARLQGGVYICRVTISVNGKVETSKSQKLIVAN